MQTNRYRSTVSIPIEQGEEVVVFQFGEHPGRVSELNPIVTIQGRPRIVEGWIGVALHDGEVWHGAPHLCGRVHERAKLALNCRAPNGEHGAFLVRPCETVGGQLASPVFSSPAEIHGWMDDAGWERLPGDDDPVGTYQSIVRGHEDCRVIFSGEGDRHDDAQRWAAARRLQHAMPELQIMAQAHRHLSGAVVFHRGQFGVLLDASFKDGIESPSKALRRALSSLAADHPHAQLWFTRSPFIGDGALTMRAFMPAKVLAADQEYGRQAMEELALAIDELADPDLEDLEAAPSMLV